MPVVTILTYVLMLLIAVFVLLLAAILSARAVNRIRTRVRGKNSIHENAYVELNGQEQYINIRGTDRNNPVMIFLHGGPGGPMSFAAPVTYQIELEKRYTIINWDQRGCGRTYFRNRRLDPENASLSQEVLLRDLDALVDYASGRFGKECVILMGHSNGTVIGNMYAHMHPEKLSVLLLVGTMVNAADGERYSYEDALERSRAAGSEKDEKALLKAYKEFTVNGVEKLDALRGLTEKYHKCKGAVPPMHLIKLGLTSPYMSLNDMRWFLVMGNGKRIEKLQKPLVEATMGFDAYRCGTEYSMPVFFIQGADDWITPTGLVRSFYENVSAPRKQFSVIENTAHTPLIDDPAEFDRAVIELLSSMENAL